MSTTYTKLRSGNWGLRADHELRPGSTVTVTTRAGAAKTETVGQHVWSGDGVHLYAISAAVGGTRTGGARSGGYGGGHGRRRQCTSGGNCSSIGSGRSCGGEDCDGY